MPGETLVVLPFAYCSVPPPNVMLPGAAKGSDPAAMFSVPPLICVPPE